MISKSEQSFIKHLLSTQDWQIAERIAKLLIEKIEDSSSIREDQWETLKTLCVNEGKIQGIRDFIKTLYEEAGKG